MYNFTLHYPYSYMVEQKYVLLVLKKEIDTEILKGSVIEKKLFTTAKLN